MLRGGAWVLERCPAPLCARTGDGACGLGLLPAPRPRPSALRISVHLLTWASRVCGGCRIRCTVWSVVNCSTDVTWSIEWLCLVQNKEIRKLMYHSFISFWLRQDSGKKKLYHIVERAQVWRQLRVWIPELTLSVSWAGYFSTAIPTLVKKPLFP